MNLSALLLAVAVFFCSQPLSAVADVVPAAERTEAWQDWYVLNHQIH